MVFTILRGCFPYSNGWNILECECSYGSYYSLMLELTTIPLIFALVASFSLDVPITSWGRPFGQEGSLFGGKEETRQEHCRILERERELGLQIERACEINDDKRWHGHRSLRHRMLWSTSLPFVTVRDVRIVECDEGKRVKCWCICVNVYKCNCECE